MMDKATTEQTLAAYKASLEKADQALRIIRPGRKVNGLNREQWEAARANYVAEIAYLTQFQTPDQQWEPQ